MLLPRMVYQMCVHGATIVGSRAKQMAGEDVEPNDYDLIVPIEKWPIIALLIPSDATLNKFGGWRFTTDDGIEVDVWPGTMEDYLRHCKSQHGGKVYAVDFIHNLIFSVEPLKGDD